MIIGGSGFLGTHLAISLRDQYKVIATYHHHKITIPGVSCFPIDLNNKPWVKRLIYTHRPDVIIYISGNNSLDWCDINPRSAERVHSFGVANITAHIDIIQPKFIYVSNSYVFDGFRGNYKETDTLLPGTVLGRVKTGGENVVRSRCLNYMIVRASPLLGRGNGLNLSFLDTLRLKLDNKERIEAATNEIHSFAPVAGFVDLVGHLIESGVRNKTLHYGGLTKISQYDFSKLYANHFHHDISLVTPRRSKYKKDNKEVSDEFIFDFTLNSSNAIESMKIKAYTIHETLAMLEKMHSI